MKNSDKFILIAAFLIFFAIMQYTSYIKREEIAKLRLTPVPSLNEINFNVLSIIENSQQQVAELLGSPTETYGIKPSGTCCYYKNRLIMVRFYGNKAKEIFIEVNIPLDYPEGALKYLKLPYQKPVMGGKVGTRWENIGGVFRIIAIPEQNGIIKIDNSFLKSFKNKFSKNQMKKLKTIVNMEFRRSPLMEKLKTNCFAESQINLILNNCEKKKQIKTIIIYSDPEYAN
jgi:hypothetical protein